MPADVSVVVPCYNASATLERCLHSVVEQVMQPREVIIVDDCSSDRSYELLQGFAHAFGSEIVFVVRRNSVNLGASMSRNIGWSLATSTYIAFLDADDTWMSDKIDRQYGWMSSYPQCVLSGHACLYPGRTFASKSAPFERLSTQRILISNPFPTPSVMLRRDIPHRFDTRQRHLEDHLLWSEIALAGGECWYSTQMLAQVYKHPYGAGGLSKNLVDMERGELRMYYALHRRQQISGYHAFFLMCFSLIKFVRRCVIYAGRFILAR